ncbi:unnamed protein product [Hermetia illucens]|uniref:DDE Tnp4 domain-containing protein n=1 Tax=Hermetia illucens TaxID=343691 RepID=A0A7R8YZT6_HERIL|nr:unnamed protein product [Hermetia illucens]
MIRPLITKRDTVMREAIPAEIRLAITLRYLATGDSYASLSFLFKVSTQSISKIVPEVAKSICSALKDYIKLPQDTGDWRVVANNFDKNWNFPHCCGAMDGKHVLIRCPQNSGREITRNSPNRIFNYRLSRARRIVENAFGLLAAVFRIFRKPLELTELETAIDVVLCCIYLHNFLRKQSSSRNIHAPFGTFDSEDASCGEIIPGSWRKTTQSDRGLQPLSSIPRKPSNDAKEIRNEFQQYFLSEEVQWQDKHM